MNLFLSLRTGIPFYCNRIRETAYGGVQAIRPFDLEGDWADQITTENTISFGQAYPSVPWSLLELIKAGGHSRSHEGVLDIFAPFPFDPSKTVPYMVGDKVMNRVGNASVITGFYMQDGLTHATLQPIKGMTNEETMTVQKLANMSLRLSRRMVTGWETFLVWANQKSSNVTFAAPQKEIDDTPSMIDWIENVAMYVPEANDRNKRVDAYHKIHRWHMEGYDQIKNVNAGETAKATMQDAIGADMPPRPNQLQKEGAQDLWAYYAKRNGSAATRGAKITKTLNSEYCGTRLDENGIPTSETRARLLDKNCLRSWLQGEDEIERTEKDAFGLDEEASEEEKLDQFLMDDL